VAAEQAGHMVGREWVEERFSAFRKRSRAGYFLIKAGAGLGKTTLACGIAQATNAPAFFIFSASQGRKSVQNCRRHLIAQLIESFNLPHNDLDEKAGDDWEFFKTCLAEAAAKLEPSCAPIVVVIDGWDESEARGDAGLPSDLPEGVFLCLTGREVPEPVL